MFEWFKNLFKKGDKMGDNNINLKELEVIIDTYLNSDTFKTMLTAYNYYNGNQDILKRERYGIGVNGERTVLNNLPNFKIVDNQFKWLVDQKANYLLSKTPTIITENEKYNELLLDIFNDKFFNLLFLIGMDAYKYGISWLYVYYNEQGELSFKRFDSREIIPVWMDNEHTELDYVIRKYTKKIFTGSSFEDKQLIEVYRKQGIEYFELKGNKLQAIKESTAYIKINEASYNWARLPIIPFKVNESETPLIKNCKTIQDAINEITSDFKNDMEESNRNTIYVVKGYQPDAGSFRTNVNQYGAIFLTGEHGSVDTLNIKVNTENYKEILKMLKIIMLENCKGFDSKSDKIGSDPNQMNIQSMYTNIDLDANALEREFKDSFLKLIWFIAQHFKLIKKGDFEKEKVTIVFNRDILINESQSIEDVIKSMNILSRQSLLAQHPWVEDVDLEIKRLEDEEEEKENNSDTFNEDFDTDKEDKDELNEE